MASPTARDASAITFADPISFTVVGVDFNDFSQSTGGGEHVFFTIRLQVGWSSANTGLVGSAHPEWSKSNALNGCDMPKLRSLELSGCSVRCLRVVQALAAGARSGSKSLNQFPSENT